MLNELRHGTLWGYLVPSNVEMPENGNLMIQVLQPYPTSKMGNLQAFIICKNARNLTPLFLLLQGIIIIQQSIDEKKCIDINTITESNLPAVREIRREIRANSPAYPFWTLSDEIDFLR